ncbi:MAG: aldo/keto reductase [Leeuwenhoekiella sp.]
MKYRNLGKTGYKISEISLGTWQVGGKWGSGFDDHLAEEILNTAIDEGVNFIDTADVYENGMSEKAVGRVVNSRSEEIIVATKCGRQINPHVNEGYTVKALRQYVEESLKRLNFETLDLIQLHCPPTEVYYRPEIFGLFEDLKKEGKIKNLGVSVEKIEEGIKALEFDNVASVQIIYNLFRQRPNEIFFREAEKKNVGVIVRVPLASGLLTGKFDQDTTFDQEDHRNFNREGEVFDKGETFAGIPFEKGLEAVEDLKKIFPKIDNLAPVALQWILTDPAVGCIIPGASRKQHLLSNLSVFDRDALTSEEIDKMNTIYKTQIKKYVHQRW